MIKQDEHLGADGSFQAELQQHRPQEGFSRLPRRTLSYSCPQSPAGSRGWWLWPGFDNRKGDHSWLSSVRLVQAAKPSSEVVVPKVDSLVSVGLCLDRPDPLLHQHCYQRFFCCIVGPIGSFLCVVSRHVPTVAGSFLEAQSVHIQAPVLPVGTRVPLSTLWHFNGAGIGFRQRPCKAVEGCRKVLSLGEGSNRCFGATKGS